MRYLLIVDAALFAMAGTLATVLAVVWLMYGVYASQSTRVSSEMPMVAVATLSFTLLAAILGLAFWSLLRQRAWHWWAQLGAGLSLVFASTYLYRVLA